MNRPIAKLRVLFLCTGNSCRSQMAEGWARALIGDRVEPHSAGIQVQGLNPIAVQVMAEVGIDISAQASKHLDALGDLSFDVVVTVCNHAQEHCPVLPGAHRLVHVDFDDPPALAKTASSEAEALGHYRRVRDQIREFVATLPDRLHRY